MSLARVARKWPLIAYFCLAYAVSALALAVIGPPHLRGAVVRPALSLAMFPVMVIGVGLIGVLMTRAVSGGEGLRELRARFQRPVALRWYAVLLLPPLAILAVLVGLAAVVSPQFAPQFNVFGILAGALAGFAEEVGWTGFAYPRMRARLGWLPAAVLLGVMWGIWHLPVVDSLGAASPHGAYWSEFFGAFVALVTALRVLIGWVYHRTGSLRMAQLLHASSTGFLVMLSAPRVTPAQEALWYLVYAVVLWAVAMGVVMAAKGTTTAGTPQPVVAQ